MKQIIRRLTALALCAILMMAMPLASAQELMTPEGGLLTVQIVITQPDGTMSLLPVTPVTNTMGNTVYWRMKACSATTKSPRCPRLSSNW
ncbi:MAG: hypothetical protein ACLUHE_13795 [Christensenellales bacterium]